MLDEIRRAEREKEFMAEKIKLEERILEEERKRMKDNESKIKEVED